MYVAGSPARWFQTLALALVALAVPARSFAQVPTFNTVIATPTGGQPWNSPKPAAVGDFNGDGMMDALIVDGTSSVRFMRGNGNSTFTKTDINIPWITASNVVDIPLSLAPYLPNALDGYIFVRTADVDGDGRLDAICGTGSHINWGPYNFVTVLINTGNDASGVPQFADTHYFLPFTDIRSMTVGDLNGDGNGDFIVSGAYGQQQIYLSNGPGTFARGQATYLSTASASTGPGVIRDLNGDGKADFVVTTNQGNGTTDIFLGNGNGTLQAPASIPNIYAVALAVADVNNDGKPDLVEGFGDGSVSVFLNNGNGTFGSPASFPTVAGGGASGFFMSDVNGDGNVDVAMSLYYAGKVAILLGNGNGTFGASYLYGGLPNAVDVTLADFTGDGKPEIASVSANGYGGQNYGVLTNTTVFAPSTVFASGTATVTTWDPIFPAVAYSYWPSQCSAAPSVGPNANWVNPHAASTFPLGSHPWEGIAPFNFAANWINAWSTLGSLGPDGQSWTKYSTPVTGEGEFVVQFLADNCSWIYLDDELIGVQDDNWGTNGTGRYPLTLTGTGPHTLSFIIWDGGGLAGGKFRLETRQSFIDGGGDPGGLTKAESTTTVSFGAGPFVYSGSAFTAIASTSPSGPPTIVYSGDCTNAGSSCTATATYAGDANHLGSSDSKSITIAKRSSVTTVSFGAGPFVYTGSAFTATSSVSPTGTATIAYSGDCVNGGTTCSATATYAGDANHHGSSATATMTITYAVCAVYADDDDDDHGSGVSLGHQSGSTIPVKVRVCDARGRTIGSRSLPVKAIGLSPAGVLNHSGNSNPGNLFRFEDRTYKFNLSTKGLAAGSYTLDYMIGADPTVYRYAFTIRPAKPKKDDDKKS